MSVIERLHLVVTFEDPSSLAKSRQSQSTSNPLCHLIVCLSNTVSVSCCVTMMLLQLFLLILLSFVLWLRFNSQTPIRASVQQRIFSSLFAMISDETDTARAETFPATPDQSMMYCNSLVMDTLENCINMLSAKYLPINLTKGRQVGADKHHCIGWTWISIL